MRNIISTLTLLTTLTLHAQVPSYVPTNGLVGWWPFSGNANDESGNGHDGSVDNAALVPDRLGNANSAFLFNGVNSRIVIGDPANGDFDMLGGPLSISIWVLTTESALSSLVTKQNTSIPNSSGEYNLDMNAAGQVRMAMGFGGGQGEARVSNTIINDGLWHHVVATYSPTEVDLYVDGVLATSGSNSIGAPLVLFDSPQPLQFGIAVPDTTPHNGRLDDIGIWNRVLSASEVLDLFYAGSSWGGTSHACGAPNVHNPDLSYGSVTDQDGIVYKTIVIGTQEWMAENLKVGRYQNGDVIPVVGQSSWAGLTSGASCWFNSDSASYDCPYGRLYNWYAVTDSRNVCPSGWHVPTDQEWTVLTDQLGGEAVAGSKMKPPGTDYWLPNPVATNESGFSALGGEYIDFIGQWGPNVNLQINGLYWSATLEGGGAWARRVMGAYENIQRENHVVNHGFSVRCIREALPTGTGSNEKDGFRVYPNPSAGVFILELDLTGPVGLQVFDARGALVHNDVFTSGRGTQRTVDLSAFAKGSYTLLVEHDGQRVIQPVVVE